ncbi:MerR family transcriptional regulator [Nonomuraea angiospora]|uniref:MerR family transcriptional regulator n=1 Tax=Nonomuraea angiospora TaxID=46172 RepID=UPI0036064449
MSDSWTIGELAERAALALRASSDGAPGVNGRVRDVPGERLIRWYTTIGLVDPPLTRRGRIAQYGRRHLLQLVAVKRLQAAGHSIAQIQTALAGATDRMLETAAGLAPASGAASDAAPGTASGAPWMPDATSGTPGPPQTHAATPPMTGAMRGRRGADAREAPDGAHPAADARRGSGAAGRRAPEHGATEQDRAHRDRAHQATAHQDDRADQDRAERRSAGAGEGSRAGDHARAGEGAPAGGDVRARDDRGDEVPGTAEAARDRQGGAREGGAREGGAREGGAREGGAREGGAREGGAREGGAREGGAREGDRGSVRGRFWAERPGKGSVRAPEAGRQRAEPDDGPLSRPRAPGAPGRARSTKPDVAAEPHVATEPDVANEGGSGGPGGAVVVGVRLGDGVRLVLDTGRVPSEEDVQAVLTAAGPLLAVLEERELI